MAHLQLKHVSSLITVLVTVPCVFVLDLVLQEAFGGLCSGGSFSWF